MQKGRGTGAAIEEFIAAANRKIGLGVIEIDRHRAGAMAEIPQDQRACISA